MKKIVALVLSLVMVLGLATTAFAATPAYYGDPDTLQQSINCLTDANTYTLEKYTSGTALAETFDTYYIWATDKLTGAKVQARGPFAIAASADSATHAFVDGKKITYLALDVAAYEGTVTAVPTVDQEDVEACGEMFTVGDVAAYVDGNGVFYVEDATGDAYNVGGKVVLLAEAVNGKIPEGVALDDVENTTTAGYVYVVSHAYAWDDKVVAGEYEITKVYCEECEKSFAFLEGTVAEAVEKFGAGNFAPVDYGNGDVFFVSLVPGAAADAEAGDKVESAETFDAGIAMYVGMSVMAAAGSAVVLKKKD